MLTSPQYAVLLASTTAIAVAVSAGIIISTVRTRRLIEKSTAEALAKYSAHMQRP